MGENEAAQHYWKEKKNLKPTLYQPLSYQPIFSQRGRIGQNLLAKERPMSYSGLLKTVDYDNGTKHKSGCLIYSQKETKVCPWFVYFKFLYAEKFEYLSNWKCPHAE